MAYLFLVRWLKNTRDVVMDRSTLCLIWLCPLLSGCPIGDQTIFYKVRGSSFVAQNVPVYRIDVSEIVVSWHPESAIDTVANHSTYQSKTIWKLSAVRPIQLAGFQFELFETPPGFQTVIDRRYTLPKGGVFSLEIYCGSGSNKNRFIYDELPAESVAHATHRLTKR